MPRPQKPIDIRIQQTREEILACENKLQGLNLKLQNQLKEKEELEKQSLYDLIKKHNISIEEVEELLAKNKTN